MEKSCKTCVFGYRNEYGRPSGYSSPRYYETVECRRYPPTRGTKQGSASSSETAAAWVTVSPEWWCGEFAEHVEPFGTVR